MRQLEYAGQIAQALSLEHPSDSVEGVKDTVIRELTTLDPRMAIRRTEYFNHSFIPDLVASWPGNTRAGERYIYLKFNDEIDYLLDDMTLVKDSQPIIFGLSNTPRNEHGDRAGDLFRTSAESNTLVTDAAGVETLIGRGHSRFLDLATSTLTQGGRGLVDAPMAAQAIRNLNEGFDGARRTDSGLTRRATRTVEILFDPKHADRLNRLLQAVWIGSGGRLEDFPGRRDETAELSDEILQFLLDYEEIPDDEFWRRLGQRVTVGQLCRLAVPDGSRNLDRLMSINASFYWARACRIKRHESTLFAESGKAPHWAVDRGLLAYRAALYAAYLAESVEQADEVIPDHSGGIAVNELRLRAAGISLNALDFSAGGRTVKYASESEEDIADDEAISEIERSLHGHVLIKRAGITLDNGRRLSCDFTTNTVTGRTVSKPKIPELLYAAIALFRENTPSEKAVLNAIPGWEEGGQLSFDFGTASDS
ncbi:hypothetical protein J5U46_07915 [Micromonospora tulbaghiae]|uniref:AIPR protein n=1 Tax=Micromonospora tulbaghiae TaxID=479978 RepID=A0AAW4JMN4_9ACTN|nr:hypothetical protein [Micromonospora tulbaghiae]MBO4140069.1 hypothetical protein [Micromonospora tulbaghiae]